MSEDILNFSVSELLSHYKDGTLSPVDAAKASFDQAHKLNPELNAFLLISDEDQLMAAAKESEARWKDGAPKGTLDGVPTSIKDWYHVTGWPTRFGSLTSPDHNYEEDSPVVARLREAGALFLGKTTLPEYGHKGATHSPVSGITRNPWDSSKTSGGSSGGDGTAAAARMGYLHLGSDAGGSIRIPASFSGVFGIKPSPGMVPHWPPSLFASLSSAGPMTRSVEDAALMMDVITQPDIVDWNALPYEDCQFANTLAVPQKRLKIAYAPTLNNTPIHLEVASHVKAAVDALAKYHDVTEITLDVPELVETFNTHWMAAASMKVAQTSEEDIAKMDPYFLKWAERGSEIHLHDYLEAQVTRMNIGQQFQLLFEDYDVLIMPTTAMPAFEAGKDVPNQADGTPWDDWTPLTFPANLGKLPASSVPAGVTKDGLPTGVQVVSGFLRDNLVMSVSLQLEQEIKFQDWMDRQFSSMTSPEQTINAA